MMSGVLRRLAALVVMSMLLAACRVDVTVDVVVAADGTGEIVARAVADAELVSRVPGLADSLAFDDAVAAGWTVEGPTGTDDGGLTVTLRHPVTSPDDATNLLASLGPPFTGLTLQRTVDGDTIRYTLSGSATFTGGFESFADPDYLAALGGAPFADEIAAAGATPATAVGARLNVTLPGAVVSTTGQEADGVLSWVLPLDGSATDVATVTEIRPDRQPGWAKLLATVAIILLVAWLLAAAVLVLAVLRRRR